ncbi:MAG: resolvase domain-containing protein [Candidatus Frackibacter sp. T328-2]|nr:MAG: resolvase domain-containing protein [Candidatus Frackibacter sp. T328-2]
MSKQKAAIYTRVSTHHQVDKDSLEFQEQELKNYSEYLLGIKDYEIFSDAGYSGKNTKRPGYQEMMNRIENGEFTHLLVWKIDRISRNLIDFAKMHEDLKEYDVTFVSKNEQFDTSSAMGEAMLKIILVFAELERNLASERVTSIMLDRAQKGLWNGAPTPLGYNYDEETQELTINGAEAKIVRYIFDLYEKEESLIKVNRRLDNEDIRTKNNKRWYTKTLSQMLNNPIYKGTYRYNYKESGRGEIKDEEEWIIVEDCFPAIIDKDQWERVNNILSNSGGRQGPDKYTHVFSSLLRCGCGKKYLAYLDRARKDGFRPSRYRCGSFYDQKKCTDTIGEVNLGPFVINYIANLVKAKKLINQGRISSHDELEDILLSSKWFKQVVGVNAQDLDQTYNIIANSSDALFMEENNNIEEDLKLQKLKKNKQKQERALDRLKNLYLYSEESMSEKDYLINKKEVEDKIERINKQISKRSKKIFSNHAAADLSFIKKATQFLITRNLNNQSVIDYKSLIQNVDKQLIKDFMNTVIKKITVKDNKVEKIEFVNGLTHRLVWKDNAKGLKGRM